MKLARMKYKYLYEMQQHPHDWDRWPRDGNLGDCIQNLAVENLYKELGISDEELLKVNRDEIPFYNKEKCILPMQAWFGNYAGTFALPWSDNIEPVFIGFHLNKGWNTREIFLKANVHKKMKAFEPIGCRDRNTRDFLCSLGLDAYFSGCMTLTFPKREFEPENGKIFIVDLTEASRKILPEEIKKHADYSITHFYYFQQYPVTEEEALEFENYARTVLERYKNEAKLVITSKIHCAMPCIAMGIPVIFIHEENNINERFDVLKGIIPLYSPLNADEIVWNPAPIDIEELKNCIKRNAFYRIYHAANKYTIPLNFSCSEVEGSTILKNLISHTASLCENKEPEKKNISQSSTGKSKFEFIKKIFSITNEYNNKKKYKVLRICNFKIMKNK